MHSCEEGLAIFGSTAGFGGDEAKAGDLAPGDFIGADAQRLNGAFHRMIAQSPGMADTLAQPYNARKGVHHRETARGGHGQKQAAIIGAEV